MLKADGAAVLWDAQRKTWRIRIHIGEEVIKRPADHKMPRDAGEEALRKLAVEFARDEGYDLDPAVVTITR